jgi:hypothetical protein
VKPLDEFYANSTMTDGHSNKCIACTRLYAKEHHKKKMSDSLWVLAQRARTRLHDKKRRAGKPQYEHARAMASQRIAREEHPERNKAYKAVYRAIKRGDLVRELCACGKYGEAHHEDYDKPLEVIWLCRTHHMERHVEINTLRLLQKA